MEPHSEFNSTNDERADNNVVRHEYRILTDAEKENMKKIKDMGADFIKFVDMFPNKREYSLAKTKIEEAVMWAVKGLTG